MHYTSEGYPTQAIWPQKELCIGSEDERHFSLSVIHGYLETLDFDFEFNVQERLNLNFLKDMLLRHTKLQLEYQKEQV